MSGNAKGKGKRKKRVPSWLVLGHTQREAERVAAGIDADGVVLVVCTLRDLEEGAVFERVVDPHRVLERCSSEDRRRALSLLGDVDVA